MTKPRRRASTTRRRLGVLCGGHPLLLTGVFLSTVLSATATIAWPVLVGWGTDAAAAHRYATLRHLGVALAVVVALKPVLEWVRVAWTIEMGERGLGRMRYAAFARVQGLPLASLEQRSTGALVSRLTADLEVLTLVVGQGFSDAIFALVVLVVATVIVVRISPLLSLASLAGIPLLVYSLLRYLRVGRPRSLAVREAVDDTLGAVQEYMTAQRIIHVAGREEDYLDLYLERSRQVVTKTKLLGRASSRLTGSFPLAYGIGLMAILAAGMALVTAGHFQGGTVSACALAFVAVWNAASVVLSQMPIFQSAGVAFVRVMQLIELDEAMPEPEVSPADLPRRGPVALQDVTFSYVPGVDVLRHIDLEIPAGQQVALVGATGAGKSALAGLIARSYDPAAGRVRFAGVALPDIRVVDLRARIVLVSQDTRLLAGTVADNIALVESSTDVEQVAAALERIGAGGCFDRLPGGLDTRVGEAGLSAGERQLIALGRVALLDPAVIILDEATAQLEPEMERVITAALRRLAEGRTMITIAHRLDTTRLADRVVVLDAGTVVEDGPPDELLLAGGRYAALWSAWARGSGAINDDGGADHDDQSASRFSRKVS